MSTPSTQAAGAAIAAAADAIVASVKDRVRSTTPDGVVKRTNQFFVDPRKVKRREGWNPRFDMGEIAHLAMSIRSLKARDPSTGGLLNDIRVKKLGDGYFELVDGDRRMTAIEQLMKEGEDFSGGVPAKLEAKDAEDLELLIRMFTANTGKAFLPLEQAHAFQRMKEGGMTLKEIEIATGCSDNTIVGALALLTADDSVVDAVKNGAIRGGLAKSIAVNARGDKAKQKELVAEAVAAGKDKKKMAAVKTKVDDARRAKAAKKGLKLKMRALTDAQLSSIGSKMSDVLLGQMAELGLPADCDLVEWLKAADLDQRVGYTFGVLQGLKAAAGVTVPLVLGD